MLANFSIVSPKVLGDTDKCANKKIYFNKNPATFQLPESFAKKKYYESITTWSLYRQSYWMTSSDM